MTKITDHDYIQSHLIPEVAKHMEMGARHYGPSNHTELGLKGQFADMYRKFRPLKRAMWEGDTTGMKEPVRQICLDLIGHCLLTISMLDRHQPVMSGTFTPIEQRDSSSGIMPESLTPQQDERLRAAGWTERDNHWSPPSRVERGSEFRQVSVITDAEGNRRCTNCNALVSLNQCNCIAT